MVRVQPKAVTRVVLSFPSGRDGFTANRGAVMKSAAAEVEVPQALVLPEVEQV